MKRIIPRIIVMLTGLVILAIGIIHNLPLAMGAGFFVFFFALISVIEADQFNRSRWNRLINYYIKERDGRIASEMKCELKDIEREEMENRLKVAEERPGVIYVAGVKKLTDVLNRAHARNMLKAAGREINE